MSDVDQATTDEQPADEGPQWINPFDTLKIGLGVQQAKGGSTISFDDAARIIGTRLGVPTDHGFLGLDKQNIEGYNYDDVARAIAAAIPAELRTEAILGTIDLRPILDGMRGSSIPDYSHGHGGTVGRITLSDAQIDYLISREDEQIRKSLSEAQQGAALTDSERQAVIDTLMAWSPGVVGLTPDPTQNLEAANAARGGQGAAQEFVAGGGNAATVTYDVDNIRMLLNTDQYTLEQILADEQAGTGTFPIQFQDRQTAFIGHGRIDRTAAGQGRKMSALTALDYLNTLSEAEVTTMQHRLADAGYFDRLGSPNVQINWGDALDPATRAAWKMLLTESAQRNVSLTTLIAENGKNYREQVRQTRLQSLDPINRNATAIVADDLAQQYLGRRLTGTEYEQLQGFLDSLRSDRAGYVQGASGPGNEAGMLPDALGFDRNDMEGYMRRTFGNETRGTAWDEMMYAADKRFS